MGDMPNPHQETPPSDDEKSLSVENAEAIREAEVSLWGLRIQNIV
jgi:hypothetical protein